MPQTGNGAQRLKSKTGCLTCRARRKKCGEERPHCIACRRNHLICTWPAAAQLNTKSASSSSADELHQQQPPQQPKTLVAVGPDNANGSIIPQRIAAADTKQMRYLLPHGGTRVYSILPNSIMPGLRKESERFIFDHYLNVTATEIVGRVLPLNPFVSHLVPVAYQDTRVVACLLALSGAHLSSYMDVQYEHDARSYYAVTLRAVKHGLLDWKKSSTQDLISLFIVMLSLCWFESLINELNGNVFYHLRASRTVLLELRARNSRDLHPSLLDLLTEVYAFLAISANITIGTEFPVSRYVPYDPFLSPEALLALNKGNENFGVLFGSSHELFGLVMLITESARYHMRVQDPDRKAAEKSEYERRILAWKHIPSPFSKEDATERIAGLINQQIVLVFLYTTFHDSVKPSPSLMEQVDSILDGVWDLAIRLDPASRIHTTMTWSARIAGSVCRKPKHRNMMMRQMQTAPSNKPRAKRTESFLYYLWDEMDKDETVYGPHGIEIIMRKINTNLGCA